MDFLAFEIVASADRIEEHPSVLKLQVASICESTDKFIPDYTV